ncbi:AbiH family protein [Lactobacillus kitasatonis]|uniref:Uncharacterized protein n=1 Tax=Lactobacillus kitasatonis TaxID=237446 RepID=A0ABS1LUM3_9LACO|nr:AbiH family protein [Lactobacillus kitasatonis]MBL1071896.1 hypothetical protein [Lactobacillus kitasatonis]
MTLDYGNNNLTRQLIVMGNGFDLQCGMPTRYQDFFDYRFGISLQYKINKYLESNSDARTEFYETLFQKLYSYLTITVGPKQIIRTSSSINTTEEKLKIISKTQSLTKKYLLQIKNQITNNIKDPQLQKNFFIEWETISSITYSKWDTIFLLANCFLSEDSIIQWNDVENIILKIVSIILLDNKKVSSDDLTSDLTFKSNSSKRYFIFGVRNCFNDNKSKVAVAMLNELQIFEENFADYINKIRTESPNRYYRPSFELLTNLMHVQKDNILDVLSFNYTLDKGCLDGFRQYFDDPRSIFTKSFRLLDNHVNNIRTKTFQKNVDVITFFGHSLNQADYSYFESIFDQYDVFHSNVKLEFYYYPGNDEVTAKSNEREVMKNVVKLLTSYGNTLANEHGENIVNKLILEQRLSVLPNPKIS